jgi:hypothetical protein
MRGVGVLPVRAPSADCADAAAVIDLSAKPTTRSRARLAPRLRQPMHHAQAGERVAYGKTENALREIVLAPEVARMLAEHRLRSPFSGHDDFVFASEAGTPALLQER